MQRAMLGLLLMGLAGLVWQLALVGGTNILVPALAILATGAGFLVAGASLGRIAGPGAYRAGWVISVLGILLFLGDAVAGGGVSVFLVASIVFALGTLVAGAGVLAERAAAVRAGAGVMAVGAFLWLPSDALAGGWAWQPGNLMAFAGAVLFALDPRGAP